MMTQYMVPLLTSLLVLVILWVLRARKAAEFRRTTERLARSSELLRAHGEALAEFLDSRDSPTSLKQILVAHSDAMNDRDFVLNLSRIIVEQKTPESNLADDQDLVAEINDLRISKPDLFSLFFHSVMAGTFAAVLRWPESAVLFEDVSTKFAADPRKDVGVAVTAFRFHKSDLPIAVARPSAAMV